MNSLAALALNPQAAAVLNSSRLRVPDELVELQLEAHLQLGIQDPPGQHLRFQTWSRAVGRQAEDRAEQDGEAPIQPVGKDRFRRPVEIAAGGNDEFDLVGRLEEIEVGP